MRSSIRELEGALHTVIAQAVLTGKRLDLNLAKTALRDTIRHTSQSVGLRDVERAVCQLFQVSPEALKSDSRARALAYPRMMAMYLARKHIGAAYSEIGRYFGGRNHSTVISAEKKVQSWLRAEEEARSCLVSRPLPTSWPTSSARWELEPIPWLSTVPLSTWARTASVRSTSDCGATR